MNKRCPKTRWAEYTRKSMACQEKLTTVYWCVERISGSEVKGISGWLLRVAPGVVSTDFARPDSHF
jgi:hypothetical protein